MAVTNLIPFTYTGFLLSAALEAGGHRKLSIQEVKDCLDGGRDIFALLSERFPGEFDWGYIQDERRESVETAWQELSAAGREQKYMIHNDGLCLLISWCFEVVQQAHPK